MIGLAQHAPVPVVAQRDRQPGDPSPRLKEPLYTAEVQALGSSGHGGAPLRVESLHVFRYEGCVNDHRRSIDQATVVRA